MIVQLRLFAAVREMAGTPTLAFKLPAGATVADLRRVLLERMPEAAPFGRHLRIAVNADYADDATPIPPDADVACIPPVSGG